MRKIYFIFYQCSTVPDGWRAGVSVEGYPVWRADRAASRCCCRAGTQGGAARWLTGQAAVSPAHQKGPKIITGKTNRKNYRDQTSLSVCVS
jgi:hypothetical protein